MFIWTRLKFWSKKDSSLFENAPNYAILLNFAKLPEKDKVGLEVNLETGLILKGTRRRRYANVAVWLKQQIHQRI